MPPQSKWHPLKTKEISKSTIPPRNKGFESDIG
jgi:hypothetical protein